MSDRIKLEVLFQETVSPTEPYDFIGSLMHYADSHLSASVQSLKFHGSDRKLEVIFISPSRALVLEEKDALESWTKSSRLVSKATVSFV